VVEAGFFDFGDDDIVALAEQVGACFSYFTQDAHGQAGAGEGLALQDVFGHAEVAADAADFILE
jgi:hypothetical protein